MRYQIHVIRAFTDAAIPTLGNPAGVLVSDFLPDPADMSRLAIKAAQPMTAFVAPRHEDSTDFDIRYYDPTGHEAHICGHATVAAATYLTMETPGLKSKNLHFYLNPECFDEEPRPLCVQVGGTDIRIDLFPSILRPEIAPEFFYQAVAALNIRSRDILSASFSRNVRDYIVGIRDPEVLLNMNPDFPRLKAMAASNDFPHEGMVVSARAPEHSGYDLFTRVFLPATGVNEDVACGSGNCSAIPYWYGEGLNKSSRHYNVLFPYPPGKAGYYGGVQSIDYAPEQDRITITSSARESASLSVDIAQAIQPRNPSHAWQPHL